jgi:DNA-binding response OmpR family regulator
MRVLVVEDDAALGQFLQSGLRLDGHQTEWIGDGETAAQRLADNAFDLVVLDLGLPRRDGMEVLSVLRSRCQRTAVLILTGRGGVGEKVKCLDLGADDCLLKPFSFHELRARCKALLRRREQTADPILRHAGVELDRMSHKVTHEGCSVELTGKEFSLLEFLLTRSGQCCSRSELLREVWHMAPDAGTNVVDVYINYLRKKLGPSGGPSKEPGNFVIETVRGSGYMIGGTGQRKPVRGVIPDMLCGPLQVKAIRQQVGA